ncbi:MAG: rRNA maturation RNase YbeY [Lachnospiraceae bacterium]|nr:rRNA maturation RNase YbeY [Lachnospiraceae bacterium]
MTIHLENEYEESSLSEIFDFDYEKVAEAVVVQALDQEKCPYEASVEILITSDEEIHRLNMEHRGIDRPTDVLSFPMIDFETPAAYDFLEEESSDFYFDPDSGELLLGDMVLSVPRIVAQAQEYGHSRKREYAFLIAHSMLHLLGYDHMEPEEAALMERKQTEILDALKIYREGEA